MLKGNLVVAKYCSEIDIDLPSPPPKRKRGGVVVGVGFL
jgi:hypothetical protein